MFLVLISVHPLPLPVDATYTPCSRKLAPHVPTSIHCAFGSRWLAGRQAGQGRSALLGAGGGPVRVAYFALMLHWSYARGIFRCISSCSHEAAARSCIPAGPLAGHSKPWMPCPGSRDIRVAFGRWRPEPLRECLDLVVVDCPLLV